MSGEATPPDEAALLVAAEVGQSDSSLLRELVGDRECREEEMEDTSSELSDLESVAENEVEKKDSGRPKIFRAATGADRRVESTQEFFRRGNRIGHSNGSRDDDSFFATPGKQSMRGALARSLSAAATSSPRQVGTAETLYSAKGSGEEVAMEGSKGAEGMDVVADDWVEEVANDEMEGVAGPDRSATLTPTLAGWGSALLVPPAVRTAPMPVPVTPTRGSKRMAMGTPRPTRHYQPVVRPGPAANSVLKQILAAVAWAERKMEEKVVALEGRMMEGMAAIAANANEGSAKLLADAEEREKRLAVKLLAMDSIELELTQKAKWEIKQWENLGVMMRSRRKEIKEIKQEVDGIAAGMSGTRATGLAPVPGLVRPTAPQAVHMPPLGAALVATQERDAMEGVVADTHVTPQEDPAEDWSDMEGVEREGLFALQHSPEFGAPKAPIKEKGKAKEVQSSTPPSATPARKTKASARQLKHQAAVDEAIAEKAKSGPETEAAGVYRSLMPPRSILKCPETAAAEKKAKEVREAAETSARERWGRVDFSTEGRRSMGRRPECSGAWETPLRNRRQPGRWRTWQACGQ